MQIKQPLLFHQCIAECLGTYTLVFFGVGSVHVAVLTGMISGVWQVASIWAVAITMAIHTFGSISGAHINPAITLAFAVFRDFEWKKVPSFISSQLLGAILAAATLYLLFKHLITDFETAHTITRGEAGSELSAMIYGEYFPNPAVAKSMNWTNASVSMLQAFMAELIGTAFLAFFVFAVTEPRNTGGPGKYLLPASIGLTVAMLICIIAPLSQAGFNPARDFGPRLVAYFAGWGDIAIPGPRGGFFTVYILAPILGSLIGAGIFQYVTRPAYLTHEEELTDVHIQS
ncbi:MAG: MIP/aquaporin family protein [Phycisphaeraceae bacterium JB051]